MREQNEKIVFGVDAEWGPNNEHIMTLLSSTTPPIAIMYYPENTGYSELHKPWCIKNNVFEVGYTDPDEGYYKILKLIKEKLSLAGITRKKGKNIDLRFEFFYSPKDIYYTAGPRVSDTLFSSKTTTHKRRLFTPSQIHGDFTVTFTDVAGWQKASLATSAASMGIVSTIKDTVTKEEKGDMVNTYINTPERILEYCLEDARLCTLYKTTFESRFISLVKDLYDIDVPVVKATTGSLTADLVESYVFKQIKIATNQAVKKAFERLRLTKDADKPYKHDYANPMSAGKISNLASKPGSACFSSLVIGGRCNNENPTKVRHTNTADVDLSSCYGGVLAGLYYPIGHPTIADTTIVEKGNKRFLTLREILKKHEPEFVTNMWVAHIRTNPDKPLSFDQDLLVSKVTTEEAIRKTCLSESERYASDDLDYEEEDFKHIPGRTCIARRELDGTAITTRVLEVLRKVGSNQELKEFYACEVQSLVLYKKTDYYNTCEEWSDAVNETESVGIYGTNKKLEKVTFNGWFALPLKGFINPLIDRRKVEKGLVKTDPDNKDKHIAAQNNLKLIVNTTYGVLASNFFMASNAVMANVITANARTGVWMVAKALGCQQTITDGGIYSPGNVPLSPIVCGRKTKLAGFDTLANLFEKADFHSLKGLAKGNLGSVDWSERFNTFSTMHPDAVGSFLDCEAVKHIDGFFRHYDLDLGFGIEHKGSNTSVKAVTFNKAHYGLHTCWNKRVYKIRGKESDLPNPIKEFMSVILDHDSNTPDSEVYIGSIELRHKQNKMIRLHDYLKNTVVSCKIYDESDSLKYRDGERIPAVLGDYKPSSQYQRFNNHYLHIDTIKEIEIRGDRKSARKIAGWYQSIPLFEKYLPCTLDHLMNKMERDILVG